MHVSQDAQDDNPHSAWSECKRSMSNFMWKMQGAKNNTMWKTVMSHLLKKDPTIKWVGVKIMRHLKSILMT